MQFITPSKLIRFSADHLVRGCNMSKRIWREIADWSRCVHLTALWQSVIAAANNQQRKAAKSLLILICWLIWKERNQRIFRRSFSCVNQVVALIKSEAYNWAEAGAAKPVFAWPSRRALLLSPCGLASLGRLIRPEI